MPSGRLPKYGTETVKIGFNIPIELMIELKKKKVDKGQLFVELTSEWLANQDGKAPDDIHPQYDMIVELFPEFVAHMEQLSGKIAARGPMSYDPMDASDSYWYARKGVKVSKGWIKRNWPILRDAAKTKF